MEQNPHKAFAPAHVVPTCQKIPGIPDANHPGFVVSMYLQTTRVPGLLHRRPGTHDQAFLIPLRKPRPPEYVERFRRLYVLRGV